MQHLIILTLVASNTVVRIEQRNKSISSTDSSELSNTFRMNDSGKHASGHQQTMSNESLRVGLQVQRSDE